MFSFVLRSGPHSCKAYCTVSCPHPCSLVAAMLSTISCQTLYEHQERFHFTVQETLQVYFSSMCASLSLPLLLSPSLHPSLCSSAIPMFRVSSHVLSSGLHLSEFSVFYLCSKMSQAMHTLVTPASMAPSSASSFTQTKIGRKARLSRRVGGSRVKKMVRVSSQGKGYTPASRSSTCSTNGSALPSLSYGSARDRLLRPVAFAPATDEMVEQVRNCYPMTIESHLSVIVRTINGNHHVLHARHSNSIAYLKHKLWLKTRRRPESMMLAFAGIFLSPDASTLLDHGIVDRSLIHVLWEASPYTHLFILSYVDGGLYPFLMHPYITVRQVKERIQHQEGILFKLQQLTLSGQILDNDEQLFRHSFSMTGFPLVLQFRIRVCTAPRSANPCD